MADPGEIAAQIATLRALSARLRLRLEISRERLAASAAVLTRLDRSVIDSRAETERLRIEAERRSAAIPKPDAA
jgi:hypothetical protein